jgi:predicted esterase
MKPIASLRRSVIRLSLSALLLVACAASSFAQDAAQVLRLSVGFGTLKNTVNMSSETRAEVDRLSKLATEANAARRYDEALRHLYHGIALMRGQQWTPARALSSALTIKLDKTIVEPAQTVRLRIGQLFQLDEKLDGTVSGRILLFDASANDKAPLKTLLNLDGVFTDFSLKPYDASIVVPGLADGKYRVEVSFAPPSGDPITKSVSLRIAQGLEKRVAAAKERVTQLESKLKAARNDRLLAALATPSYHLGLFDLANSGELNPDRIDFDAELKEAGTMLDQLAAGKDPFDARRGDFKKAYRSRVDETLQPYRIYVPASYDGSKAFPLVIALHGMGGDEDSYFEAYAKGAIKTEAEKRGYILACPKGRQPASMYRGPAETDVLDVIAEVQRSYRVDGNRIYLTGHSMGGFGTWYVAINHPDIFAAIAPISGGGNPAAMKKIAHIPELVVHGDDDKTVPVSNSRAMVAAAKEAGAEVKYVEVPGGSHISVVAPTFKDVFDWFDTHARKAVEVKAGSAQQK